MNLPHHTHVRVARHLKSLGSPRTHKTREGWLVEASDTLREGLFQDAGYQVPQDLRYSCGFPKGARGGNGKAIGQAWSRSVTEDGHGETFISPEVSDPVIVLDILVHELVHHVTEYNHKKAFKTCALAVGLTGKMTATVAGDELRAKLVKLAKCLGPYPHGAMVITGKGSKPGSRLLKAGCPSCGYLIRVTKLWAEKGLPTCVCGTEMILAG
jgi:hypothetical protein